MSPRDLLGIVVRATGLAFILFGLFDLFHIIAKVLGVGIYPQFSAGIEALGFLFWSVCGVVLVVFANEIVRFAYWREPLP
jgi:hypothetical protein